MKQRRLIAVLGAAAALTLGSASCSSDEQANDANDAGDVDGAANGADAPAEGSASGEASTGDSGSVDAASADATNVEDAGDSGTGDGSVTAEAGDADAGPNANDASDGAPDAISDAASAADSSDASGDASDASIDSGPACAKTSAGNLVTNAGFDVDVKSWGSTSAVVTWKTEDAAGCVGSGSVELANKLDIGINNGLHQCVPIQAGVSYDFGASIYIPSTSPAGVADFQVDYYTGTDCTGYNGFRQLTADAMVTNQWQSLTSSQVTPVGTQSALVYIHIQQTAAKGFTARFDRLYLTPSPGGF